MSLRARLLIGVLALTAVAMAVLGVAVWRTIDGYLIQQVDGDLDRNSTQIVRAVQGGVRLPGERPAADRIFFQNRFYIELRGPDGATLAHNPGPVEGGEYLPAPDLSGLPTGAEAPAVQYVTTDSVAGSPTYRARVEQLDEGGSVVVATPITDVEQTLSRLVTVEVIATALVLAALTVLVIWI